MKLRSSIVRALRKGTTTAPADVDPVVWIDRYRDYRRRAQIFIEQYGDAAAQDETVALIENREEQQRALKARDETEARAEGGVAAWSEWYREERRRSSEARKNAGLDPPLERLHPIGFPAKPSNSASTTCCTQPGCIGKIVDSYCNICGSPAGAAPFVPARAAASEAAPALAAGPWTTATRQTVVIAAVLFLLVCAIVIYHVGPSFLGSRPTTTVSSAPTTTVNKNGSPESSSPGRSAVSGPRSGSAAGQAIQLEDSAITGRPFETVRIRGIYRGGGDTFLRVQRWEEGHWVAFPVPTKTNQSGQFTANVELGQPGRYLLRVRHSGSGVTSKPFELVIKG